MAIQTFQIDPDATALSDNDHVAAINAASDVIDRAGSVDPAARPIEAGEIGTAELAAAGVTVAKLASTASKGNLDAMSDTARGYIKTSPQVGEFPVIAAQRDADGNLDVEYDDVAIT